jgi:hypothetical protein
VFSGINLDFPCRRIKRELSNPSTKTDSPSKRRSAHV